MPKSKPPISRDETAKRMQDELRGIREGSAIDFGVPTGKTQAPPVPDIAELGLPLSIRKQLETLTANHAELGEVTRQATKDRDKLTAQIKAILADHVSEPSFTINHLRVSHYVQSRTAFDKDVMQVELLNQGVQPNIINKAMVAATTSKPVVTLRISAGGDDE